MKLACSALLSALILAGCVPTMEMREGEERERLVDLVRQFCAAERSPDPDDTSPLLAASLRDMVEGRASSGGRARHLTSADPAGGCEPGRTWYLGGSRQFAEVRLGGRSDRLDLWRADQGRIGDIIYGRKRQVGRRSFGTLRKELIAEVAEQPAAPTPPTLPDTECEPMGWHFAFVGTDTTIYRQGAAVRVRPMVDRSPSGTVEIPLRCTSGWKVTGPATLSPDRTTVTIAPDAPPGAIVGVGFRHSDKPVELRFRVVAKDEVVLTGSWSQRSLEGCWAPEPVRELEFRPENRFSVTFMPFETYQDYWGSYTFDPATRQLRLKVEGGNFVPAHLDLEGEAELVDGRLRLTGLFLGSRDGAPQSGCTYVF
ncbi:MAG TPA: hypothetical protein VK403_08855 [Allosphingosinicella sp.]|nr:hypothetical protein [Allosphingosinicella sp.]